MPATVFTGLQVPGAISNVAEGNKCGFFILIRHKSLHQIMRILVVDDNPTVRHYYRSILEQQSGWQVYDEARTGEEALQRIESSQPDVVLLDFRMPDINGIDLAREIIRRWPAIPILLVSVHFSKQLAVAARATGIQGACAKSDIGSIVEAVRTVLHKETYFPDETTGKTAVL